MKDKMKKKDIDKIEDKLMDTVVPDSVLNLARAKMSETVKAQKPVMRKFNFKIALSCVASFALCLAIILPVTLSYINKSGNVQSSDVADNDYPEFEPPADASGGDHASGATPPADVEPYYKLQNLDKDIIYQNNNLPSENEFIVKTSKVDYLHGDIKIISEEKYGLRNTECTVYMLYNTSFNVDVLDQFTDFTEEYSVGMTKVNYKISEGKYFAEAFYNNYRYCFTGNFEDTSDFEEFCEYLF